MMTFKNPDLHLHTTFSDGTDNPKQLLENVKKAGVDIFAITDHDTYYGCDDLLKYRKDGDPYFIGGVELSCEDEFGQYHILGYCYDVNKRSIRDAVNHTHNNRRKKAIARIKFLEKKGMTFKQEDIEEFLNNENPGKPHLVKLMMKYKYIDDFNYGFKLLDECKTEFKHLSPESAIAAILNADGVPVLAHGIFGEGRERLSKEEIDQRVNRLKDFGLMGLECYYSTYNEEQQQIMLELAKKYNLLVTAGSDYHGVNKPVKIGQTNNPDPKIMQRFYNVVEALLTDK